MLWGCSSVGRALEWHSRGRGFDSLQLHQYHISPIPIPTQKSLPGKDFFFILVPRVTTNTHASQNILAVLWRYNKRALKKIPPFQQKMEQAMTLTEKQIRNIKPEDKMRRYTDGGGMYLQVSPGGGKYWRFNYRFAGKRKTLALGVYPGMSLKEARGAHWQAKNMLAKGIDPGAAKKQNKIDEEKKGLCFEEVAMQWLNMHTATWSPRHTKTVIERLKKNLFPWIGDMPIAEILPRHVLEAIRVIEARGANESAHRTLGIASQVFRYAVASDNLESDPTRDLRGALAPVKKGKFAAITDEAGAGALIRAIYDFQGYRVTRIALLVHAYTFCRPGEIRRAKWEEIDFDKGLWIIPAERMKNRLDHLVPLSRQAVQALQDALPFSARSAYIFPSAGTAERPMSDGTIVAALRRMGYTKEEMCAHGFRAMASTLLNESGKYRPDVIEAQLAHVSGNQVRAAYNRARYIKERTTMMQEWANYLESLAFKK